MAEFNNLFQSETRSENDDLPVNLEFIINLIRGHINENSSSDGIPVEKEPSLLDTLESGTVILTDDVVEKFRENDITIEMINGNDANLSMRFSGEEEEIDIEGMDSQNDVRVEFLEDSSDDAGSPSDIDDHIESEKVPQSYKLRRSTEVCFVSNSFF